MTTKGALVLVVVALLMSSVIIKPGQLGPKNSVPIEHLHFMKQGKNKLSPLLGPGFPRDFREDREFSTDPQELFPIWRKLPEFDGWDDLTLAAMLGDMQRVQELLTEGADATRHYGFSTSPLIEALSHDHPDVAALLLDKGADTSKRTPAGWTALHLAASNGWTKIVQRTLSQKANVNSITEEGWTALILAAMRGHADVVTLLLDEGADTEIRDAQGATALIYAATGGQEESGGDYGCLSALIEHGANVDSQDAHGWRPLMGAAFYGDLRSVRMLVEHGAQLDAKNEKGETARALAERNHQTRVVEFLAEVGG